MNLDLGFDAYIRGRNSVFLFQGRLDPPQLLWKSDQARPSQNLTLLQNTRYGCLSRELWQVSLQYNLISCFRLLENVQNIRKSLFLEMCKFWCFFLLFTCIANLFLFYLIAVLRPLFENTFLITNIVHFQETSIFDFIRWYPPNFWWDKTASKYNKKMYRS